MIATSELDPIVQLRQVPEVRESLHGQLCALMVSLTLDPQQEESFLAALTHQVHLTQGPPGTGKSYLGVALVRALLIVRDLWLVQCPSVGRPPILVLSYKNHAIDEFLKDLVKSEPVFRYNHNPLRSLVRIGGSCKDPALAQFSEQNISSSNAHVKTCRQKLADLTQCRADVRRDLATISPLQSFQYQLGPNVKEEGYAAAVHAKLILGRLETFASVLQPTKADDAGDISDTKEISDAVLMDCIELAAGVAHYPSRWPVEELLWKWMTGFVPRPRCAFVIDGDDPDQTSCSRVTDGDDVRFCKEHLCGLPDCNESVGMDGWEFCKSHACDVDDCLDAVVVDGVKGPQTLCAFHACWVCLDFASQDANVVAMPAEDEPPRNVCHLHPMCCALPCDNLAMDSSSYCEDHTMRSKCTGTNRHGKRCQALSVSRLIPYCKQHKPKAVEQNEKKTESTKQEVEITVKPVEKVVESEPLDEEPEKEDCDPDEILVEADSGDDDDNFSDTFSDLEEEACDSGNKVHLDNEDEVEESEHLQHLRDVHDTTTIQYDDESKDDQTHDEDMVKMAPSTLVDHIPSTQWTWAMSTDERWTQLTLLDESHRVLLMHWLAKCNQSIEQARVAFHDAEVKAKAKVYEGKAVIGGTIVGCISRLEAIRATNPFAIVVEEASEVLEPLLFVCLGASTCKFEMIGDHLQLKPSIQSKYTFERMNHIGVSMFERLIRSPPGHQVQSSVLSIQRRMRKNICDLTRDYYKDIVAIQDHDTCHNRCIESTPLLKHLPTAGREVPGVSPHVYFWSHTGQQQRASVGLSKINADEADMVCALAKYLVNCGISPQSIAILTPYKGQLMLMRKQLLASNLIHHKDNSHHSDDVALSTVDRFQGDEADIVLISLVIDAKSRTPFVKLVNRMIVLLSRARVGMYIVGNAGYFTESSAVPHWQATLNLLSQPAPSDSTTPTDSRTYPGVRFGPALPLCCPLHRNESVIEAKTPKQLALGFCRVVCQFRLSCSHVCGLACHWPKLTHNPKCSVRVPSPCARHPRELKCSYVLSQLSKSLQPHSTITMALDQLACDVPVDVQLPCSHSVRMTCAEEDKLSNGAASWPVCHQPSVSPFVHPICKHEVQVTCDQFRTLTANPSLAKKCMETVEFVPSCGHSVQIKCYARAEFDSRVRAFVCAHQLDVTLPRCGHPIRVRCPVAQALAAWTGTSATDVVEEGTVYGPKDAICAQEVWFVKRCGHRVRVKCGVAFDMAPVNNTCTEVESFQHPSCGHVVQGPCHLKQTASSDRWEGEAVQTVVEGQSSPFVAMTGALQRHKCTNLVVYQRLCQHETRVPCWQVQAHQVPKCRVSIVVPHVLCGHEVAMQCGDRAFGGYEPWTDPISKTWLQDHSVLDTTQPPVLLPSALKSMSWATCKVSVWFKRQSTCGHSFETKCSEAFKLLGGTDLPKCTSETTVTLPCGHEVTVPCFKSNEPLPPCSEEVHRNCWNYATCGQTVLAICGKPSAQDCCSKMTTWSCCKGHEAQVAQCMEGIPEDCPWCSMDAVDAELATTRRLLATPGLTVADICTVPPALTSVLQGHELKKALLKPYLQSKLDLLLEYKAWVDNRSLWKQPLFQPRTEWYFTVEKKENPTHKKHKAAPHKPLESFEPKVLVKTETMQGVSLLEWTAKNMQHLLTRKNPPVVLAGVGFTVRVVAGVPTMNPKVQANWIQSKKRDGFDSVQMTSHSAESTVFWHPYAIMATHKTTLTSAHMDQLMSLERTMRPVRLIERHRPGSSTSTSKASVGALLDSTALEGSQHLAGLRFPAQWDGESLVSTGTSASIQLELTKKLRFVPGKHDEGSPFAGVNYARTLKKSATELVDVDLLLCLELLHLPGNDEKAPKAALEAYMDAIEEQATATAHPLLFVALFRTTNNPTYIKHFAKFYGHAVGKWLTPREKQFVPGHEGQSTVSPSIGKSNDPTILQQWQDFASKERVKSDAMDELLNLIGIRKVKKFAIQLFQSARAFKKLSSKARKANQICAADCQDSGVRTKDIFVETNAQELKDKGADEFRKQAAAAMGGVLFIDEAYDLDPKGDFKGKPIVSELLTLADNKRDQLTIILAGYEDDMQEKLFSFNQGLKSRFEHVTFEDFDQVELQTIWESQIDARGWTAPPDLGVIVSKRLALGANVKGFGNARSVRKEVELATKHAMSKESFDGDAMHLAMDDVMGEHPLFNPKLKRVLDEIEAKIGWQSIKTSVREFIQLCEKNYERQLAGQSPLPVMLNRLFLGNPGTGKTTCATLYGKLLKELRFLSNGEVLMKSASDFIGQYVGESQTKTVALLELARGKVLVIDEAYNLDDKLWGKQVLDVIVEKVQNTGTDDIAVLLLGYEKPMLAMLRDQNPGLARRFPREHAFVFEDYSPIELLEIFHFTCKKHQVECSHAASEVAMELLTQQKAMSNFGNAGAVNTMITTAMAKASLRVQGADAVSLEPHDFVDATAVEDDPLSRLDKLYRMESIKASLTSLRNAFQVAQSEGSVLPTVGHFVFRGSPGTGKTTVARVMATILFQLGLIAVDHVEETSGLDMTGEYLGHTKKRVEEKLQAAKGGVLFIDEAYELGVGHFGQEAMTSLVAAMTDPEYAGVVVIVAGYPVEMDTMLNGNVGLKSRFTRFFDFPDWLTENCMTWFTHMAQKHNFEVDSAVFEMLESQFDALRQLPGFGNGRDVKRIWDEMLTCRSDRVVQSPETIKTLTESDVALACDAMLRARKPPTPGLQTNAPRNYDPFEGKMEDFQANSAPPTTTKMVYQQTQKQVQTPDEKKEEKADGRDEGVTDVQWAELEAAKEMHEQKLERMRRELEAEALRIELEKARALQEKIRQICPCPAGFQWHQVGGGWRCGGGSHYVSDAQLKSQFSI
ncbi:hypothetical protein DYB36_006893 [Aphanomyces astaci]|uniref:AAA+ ATPase domain-containing protein n=1 Tax=Aphanomyces astaci TaxID=112090 RepID=A0A397AE06_APHAT|nr:hypothetical protein DYB36_006893 [Aphanomyces astaci]